MVNGKIEKGDDGRYYPTEGQIAELVHIKVLPCPECNGGMKLLEARQGSRNEHYCDPCHVSIPHFIP